MAESKAAWDKVGEDFRVLGRQIKQHYDQRPRPGTEMEEAPEGQQSQAGQGPPADACPEGYEGAIVEIREQDYFLCRKAS